MIHKFAYAGYTLAEIREMEANPHPDSPKAKYAARVTCGSCGELSTLSRGSLIERADEGYDACCDQCETPFDI